MSREIAQQVLMDKLSQNEQFLIEEIETLPERLIDCMIEYHKQFKTLGLLPVSNNEVAVCPRCQGSGKDEHDRCDPPNWYICEDCKGSWQTDC